VPILLFPDTRQVSEGQSTLTRSREVNSARRILLCELGKVQSYNDLRLALLIEFPALYQKVVAWPVESNSSPDELALWTRLADMLPKPIEGQDPSEALACLENELRSLSESAQSQGFSHLSAVLLAALRALSVCSPSDSTPLDVVNCLSLECPRCSQHSNVRVHRLIQSEWGKAKELDKINAFHCPICGLDAVLPISFALCSIDEKHVVFWLNSADLSAWHDTGDLPQIDDRLSALISQSRFSVKVTGERSRLSDLTSVRTGETMKVRILDSQSGLTLAALSTVGAKWFSQARYEHSARIFRLLMSLDPLDPANYEGLSAACAALGQYDEATKVLEKGLAITEEEAGYVHLPKPTQPIEQVPAEFSEMLDKLLTTPSREKKTKVIDSAIKEMRSYLEQFPDDQEVYFYLGSAFASADKPLDMINTFLKIIALNPSGEYAAAARMALSTKLDQKLGTEYLLSQIHNVRRTET
jgi:tetratricopeptide (TPR) repeat protein